MLWLLVEVGGVSAHMLVPPSIVAANHTQKVENGEAGFWAEEEDPHTACGMFYVGEGSFGPGCVL